MDARVKESETTSRRSYEGNVLSEASGVHPDIQRERLAHRLCELKGMGYAAWFTSPNKKNEGICQHLRFCLVVFVVEQKKKEGLFPLMMV